jgi:ATP-dependent exoDNAse (exonuclease V) beta subunit
VALTRARDHLVLSGQAKRQQRSWRELLDRALEADAGLAAMVTDVDVDGLPDGAWTPPPEQGSLLIDGMERVVAAEERVRKPAPLSPASAVFPVTHLLDYFLCPRRYYYAHQIGLAETPRLFAPAEEGEEPSSGGRSAGDRRQRGTLAHLLLEQVELSLIGSPEAELRAHLDALLWAEGHDAKEPRTREIVDWALGFLKTPFAARMKAAGRAKVHRELPFLLRLGGEDGGLALHLKGTIDLLFEDGSGGATVIDYKSSKRHAEGLAPYAFQLDCYALAARNFVREGVPIRTGIAFLREEDAGPDLREAADAVELSRLEERLVKGAAQLLAHSRHHDWPGLERKDCQRLGCGYTYRCHGARPR